MVDIFWSGIVPVPFLQEYPPGFNYFNIFLISDITSTSITTFLNLHLVENVVDDSVLNGEAGVEELALCEDLHLQKMFSYSQNKNISHPFNFSLGQPADVYQLGLACNSVKS